MKTDDVGDVENVLSKYSKLASTGVYLSDFSSIASRV